MIAAPGVSRRGAVEAPDGLMLLALAMATVGATTWAVMAANWTDGTGTVLVAASVAVIEAVVLARSSTRRLATAAVAPLLGVLVVVPLTLTLMPDDGGEGLRNVARRYATALTTGLYSVNDWIFLVGLCGAMWLVGFWTGWLAARERRGILALLPCYVVLAINALNAPSLDNVAFPETVAVAASLLLAARVHLGALEQTWRRGRLIALPGTDRRYSRAAAGAALLIVVLALVVPPATTRDVSGFLTHIFGSSGSSGAARGPGGSHNQVENAIGFSASTQPGGPLVNDPQPVLSYTTTTDETVYLRVVNDTIFDQGNWFPADFSATPRTVDTVAGPLPRDRDPAHGGVPSADLARTLQSRITFAGPAGRGGRQAVFPGEPDSTSVPGKVFGQAGVGGAPDPGPLLTVDHVDLSTAGNTMTTVGLVSTATEDQLRGAGTTYPDWVVPRFTSLPAGGTATGAREIALITDLARQWAAGASNNYDRAKQIEARLRSKQFTYTLNPPAAPSGRWPIGFFLDTSRAGYCQYFASSMGAMLRSLGIPTRLVSGYGPGNVDDASSSARSVVHSVNSSDAHVWVEAYFPTYGWIAFEPTPSSPFGVYDPIAHNGQLTPAPTLAPQPQSSSSTSSSTTTRPDQTGAASVSAGQGPPRAVMAAGGGLVGIVVVVLAASLWLFRPRGLRGAWLRVNLLGRLFGARQRSSETFAAYARRLAQALPPDTTTVFHRDGTAEPVTRRVRDRAAEALTLIAACEGKARFSRDGLDPHEAVRWRRAWKRLCRFAPLLLWRRLLFRTAR